MTVVHRSFCRRLRLTLLAVLSAPTSAAAARPVTIAASRTLWPISPAIRATIFTRVGPLLGTGCRSAKVFVEASVNPRDLQAVMDSAYDSGPYSQRVRYAERVPPPALSKEQKAWAEQVLRDKGILPAASG